MNRLLFVVLIMLNVSANAFPAWYQCDQDKEKWEKIKARKVAFFSSKLDLTVSESQAFWPLYNEYSEKRDKLLFELFPRYTDEEINRLMNLTDKEAAERMDAYFEKLNQLNVLEKEYHQKFKKILPEHKVIRMYLAEMLFRKELLENLRESRLNKNNKSKSPVKPR